MTLRDRIVYLRKEKKLSKRLWESWSVCPGRQ